MITSPQLRDTTHAIEIATAAIGTTAFQARIERVLLKPGNQEEIRFSWWVNGEMMMRPLDLPEDHLFELLRNAIRAEVITPAFRERLRELFSEE